MRNVYEFFRRLLAPALVMCVLALASNSGLAEDVSDLQSKYTRTTFTIEDGLPDNTVDTILQTQNGLLWVGTESGLASFDGRTFTSVRLRIPGAAPPSAISSLVEGVNGDLWVGHGCRDCSHCEGGPERSLPCGIECISRR